MKQKLLKVTEFVINNLKRDINFWRIKVSKAQQKGDRNESRQATKSLNEVILLHNKLNKTLERVLSSRHS